MERLLVSQGYSRNSVYEYRNINLLVRWTPLMCASFGAVGLIIQSPIYFIVLGCFTFIGALSSTSFFDYIYKFTIQKFSKRNAMPPQGKPRRFGCGIGAVMYLLSGTGFYIHNFYLAFIPGVMIVSLAAIAALTQWCFASTLYNLIFRKNEECC